MKLEGICQDCMYLEKVKPLFDEKDKEIERLNNTIIDLHSVICEKQNKINRLNNIINELEKYLKEKQTLCGINQQGFSWGVAEDCLDKLKELKEGK